MVDRAPDKDHARRVAAVVHRAAGVAITGLGTLRDDGNLGRIVGHCPGRVVRLGQVPGDVGAAGAGPNDRLGSLLPPLWLRTVVAALLVVWGARTDRRWVVPVATAVAMPVVWINSLAVLVAIPRLRNKTAAAGDEAAIESSASPIVAVP